MIDFLSKSLNLKACESVNCNCFKLKLTSEVGQLLGGPPRTA